MHLETLGHPALRRADGAPVEGLRRKDLALLVYLCLEGAPLQSRSRLAGLLWGESPEERARHSLTQTLGRLVRVLPPGVLTGEKESVRWAGGLACDAERLLRGEVAAEEVDDAFSMYAGDLLEGFNPGAGTEDFRAWSERRRAEARNAALRLLERALADAEAAGAWPRALRLAERAVEIDPVWELGHRALMRALAARGERNRALRHYRAFERWLREEVGGDPDPGTRALAESLRTPPPPVPPSERRPDAEPTLPAPEERASGPAERHDPPPDATPPPWLAVLPCLLLAIVLALLLVSLR